MAYTKFRENLPTVEKVERAHRRKNRGRGDENWQGCRMNRDCTEESDLVLLTSF